MLLKVNRLFLTALIPIVVFVQPIFADESPKPNADGDVLIEAIEKNDEAKVDEILSRKINPNSRGHKNQYMSPLK